MTTWIPACAGMTVSQLYVAYLIKAFGIIMLKSGWNPFSVDAEIYLDFLSRSYYTIPESYQIQDFSRYGEDIICIKAG
jgi:hypothetical protein